MPDNPTTPTTTTDPFAAATEWASSPTEHEEHGNSWASMTSLGHFANSISKATEASSAEADKLIPAGPALYNMITGIAKDNPVTNAAEGLVTGKTSLAVQQKLEGVGRMTGEDYSNPQYSKNPIARHLEAGLVSGGVSAAEWGMFGKIAEGTSFLGAATMDALAPTVRQNLIKSALAVKLGNAMSGAAGVGVASAALTLAEGQKPTLHDTGKMALVGAVLGVFGGGASPETAAKVKADAQKSPTEYSSTLGTMHNIVTEINRIEPKWDAKKAAETYGKVLYGEADGVEQETVRSVLKSNPEIMASPEGQTLWKTLSGNAKTLNRPTEAEINQWIDSRESGSLLDMMFGGKGKGAYSPDYDGFPNVVPSTDERGFPDVRPASGKEVPRPEPFGSPIIPDVPVLLPGEKPTVHVGPETELGTPVSAPRVRYVLPSGADPETDIPAAPLLTLPDKLTPSQGEIFAAAKGNDWKAFESAVSKGKGTGQNFEKLVLGDILKPEHVTDPNVSRQIGGMLWDRAEGLADDSPKRQQLREYSEDFVDRSLQLRGQSTLPRGRFVRELESGDIVRAAPIDAEHSVLVDKTGKSAIVANKDLPPLPHELRVPLVRVTNAEELKQFEQWLGSNKNPPDAMPPKSKAGWMFPFDKNNLNKFSKGSLTIKRPGVKIAADPILQMFVKRMGGEAFETPEGIVTKINGVEQHFANANDAVVGLRSAVTELRKNAEQEQVITNALKTDKISIPKVSKELSGVFKLADQMTAQDESGINKFESSMLAPKTSFAEGFGKSIVTGIGRLKSMGDAGRALATKVQWKFQAEEATEAAYINKNLRKNLEVLDKAGTTSQLASGHIDPDAEKLYNTAVLPARLELLKSAKGFGIDGEDIFSQGGLLDKNDIPVAYDFRASDVRDPQLKADMKAMGMPSDEKSIADYFNSDGRLAEKQSTRTDNKQPLSHEQRIDNAKFIRSRVSSMMESLAKDRKGKVPYSEKISVNVIRTMRAQIQRLSDAAAFGPNGEKAENDIQRIEGDDNQDAAKKILADVKGSRRIAHSRLLTFFMDLARGKLAGAWTKHTNQVFNVGAREGIVGSAHGIAKTLAHPLLSHDVASHMGALLEHDRYDISAGEYIGAEEYSGTGGKLARGATTVGRSISNIGGMPLHQFVNWLRVFSTNVHAYTFDANYEKALAGDAGGLARLQDLFGAKFKAEDLKDFNKGDLRNAAMKLGADRAGGTFRVTDQPGFARESELGRSIAQFSTIKYQLARNIWEPLMNPNFSKTARAAILTRGLIGMGAGSLLTAYLARDVIGVNTMSQKNLLQSWDTLVKDVHTKGFANLSTARQAIFFEMEAFFNAEGLGYANDAVQMFLMNGTAKDVASNLISSSAANVAIEGAETGKAVLAAALAKGSHSAMLADRQSKRAIVDAVGGVFGSPSLGFVRGKGALAKLVSSTSQALGGKPYKGLPHKETKPPKHQAFRHAITGSD